MRRRTFLGAFGAAAAWPMVASAQQTAIPVVGFLNGQSADGFGPMATAFGQGLSESGFREGHNVHIEYRWAAGNLNGVRTLADELVRQRVAVIAAGGGAHPIALYIKTIPIVLVTGGDPVKAKLVSSINRPGGNATALQVFTSELEAKRLELLHECVPQNAIIGVLFDPTSRDDAQGLVQAINAAARALRRQIHVFEVGTDMDKAFAAVAERKITALVVAGGPLFLNRRARLLELVGQLQIPAIFENREFTAAGGLMSYGTNVPEVYRQMGVYVGRILKGEKPADLPVLLPAKFDISVNLKTAKSLGIEVPTSILLRADEIIE